VSNPRLLLDQLRIAYNDHNSEAMAALYSDSAVLVEPGRDVIHGQTAIRTHWAEMFEAFPDVRLAYTDSLASDSTAMAEGTIEGTHTGTYPAPSGARVPGSGRPLSVPFMTVITVAAGAIVSQRVYLDQAEITRQLRPS
jgi:steroid delta-isomerase-like uncharacterized protein